LLAVMVVLLFHYHARRIDGFIHLVNLSLQPSDLIFVDMSLLVIMINKREIDRLAHLQIMTF
uniref:hypothetical protein n=1 Tax=Prevotella sp. TaxID=59823 RepID=UPI0040250289